MPEDGDPPLLGNPTKGHPFTQRKSLFSSQSLMLPGNNKPRSTTVNTSISGSYSTRSLKFQLKPVLPLRNQIWLMEWQSMTLLNCDAPWATKPLMMDMWLFLDGEFLLLGLLSLFLEQIWSWRSVRVLLLNLITGTKLRHSELRCGLILEPTHWNIFSQREFGAKGLPFKHNGDRGWKIIKRYRHTGK